MSSGYSDDDYYDDVDMEEEEEDTGKHSLCCVHAHNIVFTVLSQLDSAISEDEMEMDSITEVRTSQLKPKVSEVECSALPQSVVEQNLSKDIEHISSIFGVSVSYHTTQTLIK